MKSIKMLMVVGLLIATSFSMERKTLMHMVSLPIIDGAGIYSSVRCLQSGNTSSNAAAITSLSLLGVNAGLGMLTMASNAERYGNFRMTHRVIGFLVSGAAIWMAASAAVDDDIAKIDKGVAGGYAALTVVPLVLFSF